MNKLWSIHGDEPCGKVFIKIRCVVSEKKLKVFVDGWTDGRTDGRHTIPWAPQNYVPGELKIYKYLLSSSLHFLSHPCLPVVPWLSYLAATRWVAQGYCPYVWTYMGQRSNILVTFRFLACQAFIYFFSQCGQDSAQPFHISRETMVWCLSFNFSVFKSGLGRDVLHSLVNIDDSELTFVILLL